MKRLILFILILPQILYAQYQSKEFMLIEGRNSICQLVGITATRDSIVSLSFNQPISGLFISGTVAFGNMQDSYARVTVKDRGDVEYLVYENYPLLSNENPSCFSKVAVESILLDDIVPTSMKIEVFDASVQIDSVYYSAAQNLRQSFPAKARAIRQEQTLALVDKLNAHLRENHMPWYAGCTSVALKTLEEKKMMFGNRVPCLHGFDFYKGGLYVISPNQINTSPEVQSSMRSNSYVSDFDWRNRHGKNWITSVKQQHSNTCWDFASVATIESNFNIYFNQVFEDSITNNLSEQELVSCIDNDGKTIYQRLHDGGFASVALGYVKRNGIVREECFPWSGEVPCDNKCRNPQEQVSFSSSRILFEHTITYTSSDSIVDTLKKAIIKSPIVVSRFRPGGGGIGHTVSCVGFHQIQMGDTLCNSFSNPYLIVVDSTNSSLVGLTSWIIKNSWGSTWGENGFARMAFEGTRYTFFELLGPYTSLVYSDTDRCVTDEDMDGYYTWGSGTKPTNLPIWVPDEQDGDDSNPIIGAIDEYGKCDTLTINPAITWNINTNVNYSVSDDFTYPNIVLLQDGILNINCSTMTMKRNAVIRVLAGGKLIVHGGQILEADIVVENGGTLIIDDGGLVRLRHNGQYRAQTGAKVIVNSGKIENN